MNTIVGSLWRGNDTAPLIMPGSVPLRDGEVMTEITQYLDDQWKVIIDADVDGPNAAPAQVAGHRQDGWPRSPATLGVVIHVEQTGAAGYRDLSNQRLRPILQIRGLTADDRAQIERLICEAESADKRFDPDAMR